MLYCCFPVGKEAERWQKKKAKKKEPVFDDYEYGYGYDYLLDDEEQKSPPTPLTMPMGRRKMMKAPGGRMSRRKRYWLVSVNPTVKIMMKVGSISQTMRQ